MFFLELRREPGVYSRVKAGMALQNLSLYSEVRTRVWFEGHLRNLHEAWQGKTDAPRGEAGDQVSLSSCLRDIGIPINIPKESGNVTF